MICILGLCIANTNAQSGNIPRYQGLLWEITGNGLTKPSYLFGTMHVSSKLAFHLSDSFYYALKQVDAVALELNPELWQAQMVRLAQLNENFAEYSQPGGQDFLLESDFSIAHYQDNLKAALSTEPPVVNSLLYRSYKVKEDFEEDTFLDLYIFQAGRKLGKEPAGVEDYYESEKLVMEAYSDMANEKKKKELDLEGESVSSLLQKLQQAYRNGDLDLMDSLDNKMEKSPAFREKFLYRRNEIQAASIDSILKIKSLFVGVGAAHLPGNRGVIALLRKMGYTLRPVKMTDRDAAQKELMNQMKVPVTFSRQKSTDGMYEVNVPGPLFSLQNNYTPLQRVQYADMSNGAYYMVTRVQTYASWIHQSQADVALKTDSLLYEYIPGKILSKKEIKKNGFDGLDIVNRTARGDKQRYQIFYTPFELIIFKMSGKGDYIDGDEGNQFFGSIKLKEEAHTAEIFWPQNAGFRIVGLPAAHAFFNKWKGGRWEFETSNKLNGNAYMVMMKTVNNFDFLEKDSFDLALIESSFRSAEIFDKQLSRKYCSFEGYPALQVKEKLKAGDYVHALFVLKGPHYFVLAQRTKIQADRAFDLPKHFSFEKVNYTGLHQHVDTFLNISIPVATVPQMDVGIRAIIEKSIEDAANGNNGAGYVTYWKKPRSAFISDANSQDAVSVQVQEFPKYYFIKDSSKYWKEMADDLSAGGDMYMHKMISLDARTDGSYGRMYCLRDTGSSRVINRMVLLTDKYQFIVSAMGDTLQQMPALSDSIFRNFKTLVAVQKQGIYQSKIPLFFNDLFSKDSATHKIAQQSISNIYFSAKDAPLIVNAIERLSIIEKDYFDSKTRLIAELGYIKDSISNAIPLYLKKIYEQTADTSMFQNEAIEALARCKTTPAYQLLKELMLQDPPIFESTSGTDDFFNLFYDSLQHSAMLYPEILQLNSLEDYKKNIMDLLVTLADSGYVHASLYKNYLPGIIVDAKVALRKQQVKDEKNFKEQLEQKDNNDDEPQKKYYNNNNSDTYQLNDYALLLMPYFDSSNRIASFFDRLLRSSDQKVQINTVALLLKASKQVPDSILLQLAADDNTRAMLYRQLEKDKLLKYFPAAYNNQLALAQSLLVEESEYSSMDSIQFYKRLPGISRTQSGHVYFFKYRIRKTDDWKIAYTGLQPFNLKQMNCKNVFASFTEKKLPATTIAADDLLKKEMKKQLFASYRSGHQFFTDNDGYGIYQNDDGYNED